MTYLGIHQQTLHPAAPEQDSAAASQVLPLWPVPAVHQGIVGGTLVQLA